MLCPPGGQPAPWQKEQVASSPRLVQSASAARMNRRAAEGARVLPGRLVREADRASLRNGAWGAAGWCAVSRWIGIGMDPTATPGRIMSLV